MSRRNKDGEFLEFAMAVRAVARSVAKEQKPEEVQKTPQRLEWERQRELAAAKSWPWPPEWPWTTTTKVGKRVKQAWHRCMDARPSRERVSLKAWVRTEVATNGYCMRWARSKGMANA